MRQPHEREERTHGTITLLLSRVRTGDEDASDQLYAHVYDDLKRMARQLIASKARPWTAHEATALVGAACERLLGKESLMAEDRRHFFFLLGRAMKDVLVEQARSDLAIKRGGRHQCVPLDDVAQPTSSETFPLLDVQDALDELREHDPVAADVVTLRFYAGRSLRETAELTGCSLATVRGDWEYAKAWLHKRLVDGKSGCP